MFIESWFDAGEKTYRDICCCFPCLHVLYLRHKLSTSRESGPGNKKERRTTKKSEIVAVFHQSDSRATGPSRNQKDKTGKGSAG